MTTKPEKFYYYLVDENEDVGLFSSFSALRSYMTCKSYLFGVEHLSDDELIVYCAEYCLDITKLPVIA